MKFFDEIRRYLLVPTALLVFVSVLGTCGFFTSGQWEASSVTPYVILLGILEVAGGIFLLVLSIKAGSGAEKVNLEDHKGRSFFTGVEVWAFGLSVMLFFGGGAILFQWIVMFLS